MNYEIRHLAWCKTEKNDKIWGWATFGSQKAIYNFWGVRGKKYTFKRYMDEWLLSDLAHGKEKAGRKNGTYIAVDLAIIEQIIPNFHEEFTDQFMMAKLFDNFHGKLPLS